MFGRLRFFLGLTRAHVIARRYFVTNGFDGALTMLGLTMGFYASGEVAVTVVISACLGAAVALFVSGIASAYVSESAEREQELRELERALVSDIGASAHGEAARWVPVLVAAVNGLAPLTIALLVMTPLFLAAAGITLGVPPLLLSIATGFALLFLLGIFLGAISGEFWLWAGLRTLLIALLTGGLVYLITGFLKGD
jgi:predicted membrane protein (TIGR00267 family)